MPACRTSPSATVLQLAYDEPKRVVRTRISDRWSRAEEMTRCIHCTRCVRFGQENRGHHGARHGRARRACEIMPFVLAPWISELAGNMITSCPVGSPDFHAFSLQRAHLGTGAAQVPVSPPTASAPIRGGAGQGLSRHAASCAGNKTLNESGFRTATGFPIEALNSATSETSPMLQRDGKWKTSTGARAGIHCRRTRPHPCRTSPKPLCAGNATVDLRGGGGGGGGSCICWASLSRGLSGSRGFFPFAAVGFFRRGTGARSQNGGHEGAEVSSLDRLL